MFYIYKAISPSGNIYIGQTVEFDKRKAEHEYAAYNVNHKEYESAFKRAIRKYGIDNISWSIIDIAANSHVANELEKRYINHFNSFKCGYNSTIGGEGVLKWTYEDLKKEAEKYKSRGEFQDNSKVAYMTCRQRGLLNELCSHMNPKLKKWTKNNILKIAKTCKNKTEFHNRYIGGYTAAKRLNILDQLNFGDTNVK